LWQCYTLENIDLSYNKLDRLPLELGKLYKLFVLRLDHNGEWALPPPEIAARGGRSAVVYLRENLPPPPVRTERDWISVDRSDRQGLHFSCVCYNVLAEQYANGVMYGYCPDWALTWEYRREAVLRELLDLDVDIMGLQEVQWDHYTDFFEPQLAHWGYKGVFKAKGRERSLSERERFRTDGCAIFFRSARWELMYREEVEYSDLAKSLIAGKYTASSQPSGFARLYSRDNIALWILLRSVETGQLILVVNTHMHWNPSFSDVKIMQSYLLLKGISSYLEKLKCPANMPIVILGDFNSTPDSGVYQFLTAGSLPSGHAEFLGHDYGISSSKKINHSLSLYSAYDVTCGEPSFTNFTADFTGVLDYIFFASPLLKVVGVLEPMRKDMLPGIVGLPHPQYPSDHLPIACEFVLSQNVNN